jgi:hypothetical protein
MYGSFDASAQQVWDFVRCQRPDGSYYGTSGKCRKGTEVSPAEVRAARPKTAAAKKALSSASVKQLQQLVSSGKLNDAQKVVVEQEIQKKKVGGAAPGGPQATKPEDKPQEKPAEVKKEEPQKTNTQPSIRQTMENKIAELEKKYKQDQSSLTKGELEQAKRDLKERVDFEARTDHYRRLKEIDRRQEEAMKSMTKEDLKAIHDYTEAKNPLDLFGRGRSYKNLNSCVRKPKGCKDEKQQQFAKELDSALQKMPKNEDGVPFYRGVPVNRGTQAFYDMLKNAKPGTVMKDPGYGSYSSSDAVARSFGGSQVGGKNKKGKKMIIFVNKGKEIRPINKASAIKEEHEGILPRGQNSTIRKVSEDDQGNLIVEVD